MQTESDLLLEWYWPLSKASPPADQACAEFKRICAPLFKSVSQSNRNWVLRDFHSPNLIWRPEQSGLAQVGLIDFQDALRGPAEYDLVSLLQDARIDVPSSLEDKLLQDYCARAGAHCDAAMDPFDPQAALFRYRVLGAQRNMKILGIFARLAMRDKKPHYLAHVPRIWHYLERDLCHPDLKDLKQWVDHNFPDDVRITKTVP